MPPNIEPLIVRPECKLEMRLFGIEAESDVRDLFTFQCPACGQLEVRGVLVGSYKPTRD
jgi:hypothetical protein